MFDKKNKESIENINAEFETIKDCILDIMDSTSIKGKEINPLLGKIEKSLNKLGVYLDSVGLGWASKNTNLDEMKGYVRKLNILFNGLVKDLFDKAERAKLKGKKFVVPENKAKELREEWHTFADCLKEKTKSAAEKREKRQVRKARLLNFMLPLDFDSKEDKIVSERVLENQQFRKDRELIVKNIAKHFKVDYNDICKWPDEKIIATAEMLFGKESTIAENRENAPKFE